MKFLSAIALGGEDNSRFLREAQAAALNHPNICTIHAIDEVDGQMFIAMEFIDGQSLREKIVGAHGRVPLPIDEAIKFASQIADGLPRFSFFNTKGKSGRTRKASPTATSKAPIS